MAKHIGIVACSSEGAALCYRTICLEAAREMGEHMHPEVSMHTHPLGQYMAHIRTSNWKAVAALMVSSADKMTKIGADFLICPDNTIHEAFRSVLDASPLPWLHIAEVVAQEALKRGFSKLAILGTKYLMVGPVYPEMLARFDIAWAIPKEDERDRIDQIIFRELVNGVFAEESRHYLNRVIDRLGAQGCDAVVLACTEIPLLVNPEDCPLPPLDSTRLLARAALRDAIGS
jgi:aspartate racemase